MSNEVVGQFPVPPLYFVHFGGGGGAPQDYATRAASSTTTTAAVSSSASGSTTTGIVASDESIGVKTFVAPPLPPAAAAPTDGARDVREEDHKNRLIASLAALTRAALEVASRAAGHPEAVMAQKVAVDAKVAAMFAALGEYKHHEALVKLLRHAEQQLEEVIELETVLQRAVEDAEAKLNGISS